MGVFDRILQSPATRRLYAAEKEAERWASAPAPSRIQVPFSGGVKPPAPPQKIDWYGDQMPPQPETFTYQPGYSDHTYQSMAAPMAFDGFDEERINNAVKAHRLGFFYETSALLVALMSFSPIQSATAQAIAPILALRRHMHGGDKGLAKMIRDELEAALIPRAGLLPTPYLPPSLWGTMATYIRYNGFCVLQHVDGDPDEDTGVRPRYTRIWEPWAVNRYRSPRKAIAITTEGNVEIKNDGHFTMVEDSQEGYLTDAAILCLGRESFNGLITQQNRLSFTDFFGKPKLWVKLPPKVPTQGAAGDLFAQATDDLFGPDGRAIFPDQTDVQAVAITGQGSKVFQDALIDAVIHIYMVLVGSAGTIGSGGPSGAGPYQAKDGGVWGVRYDLIARTTLAIVRALNQGHCAPYCDINYREAIARAKRSGAWKDPVLEIPLPARDRDERIKSVIDREDARTTIIDKRRANGIDVDQSEADKIADALELPHVPLANGVGNGAPIYEWQVREKIVAPDQALARLGLPPIPDGMGSPEQLAKERQAGKDKTGAKASVGDATIDGHPPTVPEDAEPADAASSAGGADGGGR